MVPSGINPAKKMPKKISINLVVGRKREARYGKKAHS